MSKEAELRENANVLDIDSYMKLRRANSGTEPSFALIEYVHGLDLPDEVFEDPVFTRLYWLGVDLICLANVSRLCFKDSCRTARLNPINRIFTLLVLNALKDLTGTTSCQSS